jgi:hypothetical protein
MFITFFYAGSSEKPVLNGAATSIMRTAHSLFITQHSGI